MSSFPALLIPCIQQIDDFRTRELSANEGLFHGLEDLRHSVESFYRGALGIQVPAVERREPAKIINEKPCNAETLKLFIAIETRKPDISSPQAALPLNFLLLFVRLAGEPELDSVPHRQDVEDLSPDLLLVDVVAKQSLVLPSKSPVVSASYRLLDEIWIYVPIYIQVFVKVT